MRLVVTMTAKMVAGIVTALEVVLRRARSAQWGEASISQIVLQQGPQGLRQCVKANQVMRGISIVMAMGLGARTKRGLVKQLAADDIDTRKRDRIVPTRKTVGYAPIESSTI